MLDVNELAKGEKFMSLGSVQVSDDGNLLAYTTDNVGFRQYKLHIKDLRTGTLLPDTAERVDSVVWAADNKTLLYTTEDVVTKRSNLAYRHILGSAKDPVIYDEKDERYNIGLSRTRDRKYILLSSESHATTENRFLRATAPTAAWEVIEPRKEGVRYFVDEGNDVFFLRVDDAGPSYRLVTAPVATPGKSHWTELLPMRPDVPLEDIDIFHTFYVVTERAKGLPVFRVFDTAGKSEHSIDFPDPAYSASGTLNPEFDTDLYRYNYESKQHVRMNT